MKFGNPLLVVTDLERSKAFYRETLGLEVIRDFGANVTLTGGVCLQTRESWMEFLSVPAEAILFGGQDAELYFEEDDFDAFAERLKRVEAIQFVHPVIEHRWGQRVIRLYDPDQHVIEVGETMDRVVKHFLDGGRTVTEVAERMDVPEEYIQACIQNVQWKE